MTLLHHVRTGPRGGPPVLLLHAAGLDLTYWDHQIQALGRGHDVIVPDLPGHGRSPMDGRDWTFARVVADLAQLLDGTGAGRAHLVGISVGGMIAQAFAIAHPERVESLSLIATASEFPDAARAGMRDRAERLRAGGMAAVIDETMRRWFAPGTAAARPDLLERTTRTLLADDPEVHARLWEAVAALDTTARLPSIDCPALILAGELDESCPPAALDVIRRQIDDARLAVLPGTAHMITLEQPELVASHLSSFLTRLAPDEGVQQTLER